MRFLVVSSTVLAILGAALVYGALHEVPYTVSEEVKVERSKVWIDDIFILQPNTTRSYVLDSIAQNWSIFQIDLYPSVRMGLRIISEARGERVFEWERGATFFWTPPSIGGIWRFAFYNPSATAAYVPAKVTEYYPKVTEYRTKTLYRSTLASDYGYAGILVIIAAAGLNIISVAIETKRQTRTKLTSET